MAYIDNKIEFLSKSISAMSSLADDFVFDVDSQTTDLDIGFELLTCNYMQQQSSDSALSEEQQANALTVLVNNLDLNNVPASLTYALPVSYVAASTVVVSHNDQTTGKQGGSSILDEFFHLTLAQVQKLNQLSITQDFSDIGGDPLANASLNSLFSGKQASINTGSSGQFYAWDKTMRQVLFSNLGSVPTTLAGYGVSAGDTLFDNRYIQAANPITGYTIGANAILANTDTWIGALGKLQAQISNRENYLGLPAVNGYVLSSTTAGVRSWVPFAGGGTVNSVAIASANGFAGSSVTSAGVSTVTLRTSVTGILKGNGTAISAAVPMTDYLDTTGATNGDTILYTGGVATWSPGLVNPMDGPGQMIYGGVAGVTTKLAPNATATNRFLRSVSSGNPSWELLSAGDIPAIDIAQVTGLTAALANKLGTGLTDTYIYVGNAANAAVGVAMYGDATIDNTGSLLISDEAVTFAKMQNITATTLVGRWSAGDGPMQEIIIGTGLNLSITGELTATGAGGSPGGSDTQLQYNNAGAFGGITGATTNGTFVTLTTPVLGVASATSINKVAFTAPATGSTLTIADGKTLTASNTLTFTGTDASSIAFGSGGTVAYVGLANSWTAGVKQTFAPNATNAGINVGTLAGQPSSPANGDLVYNSSANALQAYINGAWVSLGAGGGGGGGVTTVGTFSGSAQTNGANITGTTITFGPADATTPGMVSTGTQTWAGAKTFSGSTTFSLASGGAIILSGAGSTASAAISFTGATMRWINFGAAGAAAPTITGARSLGTKIVLSNTFASGSANDFAIGLDTFSFWFTLQNNSAAYSFQWYGGASSVMQLVGNGQLTLTPVVQASGAIKGFAFTGPLNTGQSSTTEISSFSWTSTGRQWSTGAIGTQREFLITAPTYSFVGASTITNAATFAISGAPVAGTNATLTNSYALWVQGGVSQFDGNIRLTQTVTTETVISDTTVTMVINGTTYKLLARA